MCSGMNTNDLIAKGYVKQLDGSYQRPVVRSLVANQGERTPVQPLVQSVQKRQKGKGAVEVLVSLITCRARETDDDNNIAELKPLRDAVAAELGIDDADRRIKFQYAQCETRGETGVVIRIEQR